MTHDEIKAVADSDHARGCQGRNYTCTCGYDDRVDAALRALTAPVSDAETRKIVTWLEDWAGGLDELEDEPFIAELHSAADHIEKLARENAALRAERDEISAKKTLQFQRMDAACEKLSAERDALREALTLAANRLDRLSLDKPYNSRRWFEVGEWVDEARAALSPPAQASAPGPMRDEMREALRELYAIVKGECPSLLDDDSGGDGRLDLKIEALLSGSRDDG